MLVAPEANRRRWLVGRPCGGVPQDAERCYKRFRSIQSHTEHGTRNGHETDTSETDGTHIQAPSTRTHTDAADGTQFGPEVSRASKSQHTRGPELATPLADGEAILKSTAHKRTLRRDLVSRSRS